jgi:hypothetical protein
VMSRKVRYWARCCGTSRTTRYFGQRSPRLGADVLRHVGAGMGVDMGQDRPFGGTGGGLRGRSDQRVGAEGIPEKSGAMWFCWNADYGTPPAD